MSEAKRPLKVFLSHAHSDADAVRALYDRLTADGVDAWLDKENFFPARIGNWESARQLAKQIELPMYGNI